VAAPLLLALCRMGQGLGLGGEWAGAVLLAIENAPAGQASLVRNVSATGRAGGFLFSGGTFLLLSRWLTNEQFFAFGWRLPFLLSALLVLLGLYVRLDDHRDARLSRCHEPSRAREGADAHGAAKVPQAAGAGDAVVARDFVLFYLMTGLRWAWATTALGYGREKFLVNATDRDPFLWGDDSAQRTLGGNAGGAPTLIWVTIRDCGLRAGDGADVCGRDGGAMLMMALGLSLMGMTYGPAGYGAFGAVSYRGALHRNFAGVQLRRDCGGFAGALHRHPGWRGITGCNMWATTSRSRRS